MKKPYDFRNCSSLFGYASQVHMRSGGICQLCGYGAGKSMNLDLWRQLTVEHIIGRGQGGYLSDIRLSVVHRFPKLSEAQREELARAIDATNTVTACSFCNSTTSRAQSPLSMRELIETTRGEPADVMKAVQSATNDILKKKRAEVEWKLDAIRGAFERLIAPALDAKRS